MLPYLELAFAWLLFLAIPALSSGMFYRAWKSYKSPVAEHAYPGNGLPFASRREALACTLVHAAHGAALCIVFAAIVLYGLAFSTWSGMTALIVWSYCLSVRLLGRKRTMKA